MKIQIVRVLLLLAICLTGTAGGDQLYVRNRPFKGFASGVSKNLGNIQVELGPLAQLLGYQVSEVEGNWVMHKTGEPAALPEGTTVTGKLFVQNKELAFSEENGLKIVSLKDFSELVGGRLKHNSSLATVDFDIPAARDPLASTAKYQLIHFGANW